MKYLFAPVHLLVGSLIRLVDFLTSPTPLKRSETAQVAVVEKCKNLTLYHYPACPFCVRVRRTMKRLNLPIRQIDPRKDPHWMHKLQTEGGKVQVPCLQIVNPDGNSTWMYESADINRYLEQEFAE
jgi:glutaredoxin